MAAGQGGLARFRGGGAIGTRRAAGWVEYEEGRGREGERREGGKEYEGKLGSFLQSSPTAKVTQPTCVV